MKRLEDTNPKTIFVNLDENNIIYPIPKVKKILKLMPVLNEIKLKLKEIYHDFNKDTRGFIYGIQKNDHNMKKTNNLNLDLIGSHKKTANLNLELNQKPKNLIYNQNKLEDEKCKKIFEMFKNTLEIFTLKKLPLKPITQSQNDQVLCFFLKKN